MQQVIEQALQTVFKRPVGIWGCGRTDAQVHASQYFFHADLPEGWDFDLRFRLNKMLPAEVAVFDIIPVDAQAHARYDATLRAYDYFLHTCKDPFLAPYSSLYLDERLDVGRMAEAVALLPRYQEYGAFCISPERYKHTRCRVSEAALWVDDSGTRLRFYIQADRFLGRMIRIIMARLVRIGNGQMPLQEFEHLLQEGRGQGQISHFAYPQGLFLSKVAYPYLDLPVRPELMGWQHARPVSWERL